VEIPDWVVADEFRRCVIDASGKVHNGSVGIERLPSDRPPVPPVPPAPAPVDTGFVGMFEVTPKPTPAPTDSPTTTQQFAELPPAGYQPVYGGMDWGAAAPGAADVDNLMEHPSDTSDDQSGV
jgi:hypothetical protein